MTRAPARVLALRAVFTTVGSVAPGIAARWRNDLLYPARTARAIGGVLASGPRSARERRADLAAWMGAGPTGACAGGAAARPSDRGVRNSRARVRVVAFDAPGTAARRRFARCRNSPALARGRHGGPVLHRRQIAARRDVALGDGLAAERVVLLAAPADVTRFSTAFADHLRLPSGARAVMRRNLEARLQIRWEDLHLPTIARTLSARALLLHDRKDEEVPFVHVEEIAAAWPDARLVPTAGLGHRGLLRDPEVVRETVAFLREAGGR